MDEYPALSKDLQEVLQTIEKNIQIRDKHVEQNVKDLIHAGGNYCALLLRFFCASWS